MDWINTPFPGWNIALVWACIFGFAARDLLRLRQNERTLDRAIEIVLVYVLGIGGFSGVVSGLLHIFFGDQLAESIGWPPGNLFQWEVGFASIAIGLIGFMCFWRRDFWWPAAITRSVFGLGAGATHVADVVQRSNFAPGNAGPTLFADFLVPILLLLLMGLHTRHGRARVATRQRRGQAAHSLTDSE